MRALRRSETIAEPAVPVVAAPDAPEEREPWLPAKFKTAQDLATSYGELERKLGQLSQRASRAAELEAQLAALGELASRADRAEARVAELEAEVAALVIGTAWEMSA